MTLWRKIFDTANKGVRWGSVGEAAKAAREAGYPMMCWNGDIFAIADDGTVDLKKPLFTTEDLDDPRSELPPSPQAMSWWDESL